MSAHRSIYVRLPIKRNPITAVTTNTRPQIFFSSGSNLRFGGRQSTVTMVFHALGSFGCLRLNCAASLQLGGGGGGGGGWLRTRLPVPPRAIRGYASVVVFFICLIPYSSNFVIARFSATDSSIWFSCSFVLYIIVPGYTSYTNRLCYQPDYLPHF